MCAELTSFKAINKPTRSWRQRDIKERNSTREAPYEAASEDALERKHCLLDNMRKIFSVIEVFQVSLLFLLEGCIGYHKDYINDLANKYQFKFNIIQGDFSSV